MSKQSLTRVVSNVKRVRDAMERLNKALKRGAAAKSSSAVLQQKDYAMRALNDLVDVQADLRTNVDTHLSAVAGARQAVEGMKKRQAEEKAAAKAAARKKKADDKAAKAANKAQRKTAVKSLVAAGTPKKAAKKVVKAQAKVGGVNVQSTPRAAWPFPTAASQGAKDMNVQGTQTGRLPSAQLATSATPKADNAGAAVAAHKATAPAAKAAPKAKAVPKITAKKK